MRVVAQVFKITNVMKLKTFFSVLILSVFFSSCSKDNGDSPSGNEMTDMSVEFDNIVGGQNLFLNDVNYTNAAGEQFNISLLQYFISNIQLRKTDGTVYTLNQDSSYFLIRESDPASRYARFKAPAGDYNQLTFVLGVDSLRSTMDVTKRTGALDPGGSMEDGMYWGWNSGYIFFKMEGISPLAPLDPSGQRKFRYHIGGFGGYSAPTLNNIRTVTLDLASSGIAQARAGRTSNIHLMVDVMKVFNGGTTLSIAQNPTVMFSDYSLKVSENYTSMFEHDHTEN